MFAREIESASRQDTVTVRKLPKQNRWVPDTIADRNVMVIHKLPTSYREFDGPAGVLRMASEKGLWVAEA